MKRVFLLCLILILSFVACTNDYDTMKEEIKSEIESDLNNQIDEKISAIDDYNLDSFTSHLKGVSQTIQNCTVGIEVEFANEDITFASGMIYKNVDNTYYILTNEHNIRYGEDIFIHIKDDVKRYQVGVYKSSPDKDLAILNFTHTSDLTVCTIEENNYEVGDMVLSVGTAVTETYFFSVTMGIVSNVTDDYIQHDAAINVGSSGGPLFNINGEFIGLNVSKLSKTSVNGSVVSVEGVGFAIPLEIILEFIS